uniref:Uncharacterized protein n=1 Tax=Leersia perrieri TaxID=77586 RepID=A0A0D9W9B1_9ORYZ
MELELLSLEAVDHPFIKYVLTLGCDNRLFNVCQTVPHETYDLFMDGLTEAVRDEIADCSAEAYE